MIYVFLLFGFLTIATFLLYSHFEGGILNAFFIITLLKFAIEFVLEPISWSLGFGNYRPEIYARIYLISYLLYGGMLFGAMRFGRRRAPKLTAKFRPASEKLAWGLLALAVLLYLPILIEFREYILEPRLIYEQTRSGYGVQFFGSALLVYSALIVFLFSNRAGHLKFILVVSIFILLKGQKGQFLTICGIYVFWLFYVRNVRVGITRAALIAGVGSAAFAGLFAFNYRGEIESLVGVMAGYSDYNRNAALVLEDDQLQPYMGQLAVEGFLLSKIPRALWENKPKNFGAFRLADRYYPEWFDLDQGAPAFGVGVLYADFGAFSYFVALLLGVCSGLLFKFFLRRLLVRPKIHLFVMALFCSGIELIPAGVGYFIVEHFVLGLLLTFLVALTYPRKRQVYVIAN